MITCRIKQWEIWPSNPKNRLMQFMVVYPDSRIVLREVYRKHQNLGDMCSKEQRCVPSFSCLDSSCYCSRFSCSIPRLLQLWFTDRVKQPWIRDPNINRSNTKPWVSIGCLDIRTLGVHYGVFFPAITFVTFRCEWNSSFVVVHFLRMQDKSHRTHIPSGKLT